MKTLFLTLLFLTASIAWADVNLNEPYPSVAKTFIPQTFEDLIPYLEKIDKNVLPHDVKIPTDIRKKILKVRDSIDLFAYAMPSEEKSDQKMFESLREDLDEGYELMGSFKDLFDIQNTDAPDANYNVSDVEDRRKPLRKWIEKYLKKTDKYRDYLQKMDGVSVHQKQANSLSSFYWGGIDFKPDRQQSAQIVFENLIGELITKSQTEWPEVRKILNPAKNHKNIEVFHDFRKRIRTITKIMSYFPSLVLIDEKSVLFLQELTQRYGVISDQVAKLELALDQKKKSKAEKIITETETLWADLQSWEDENKIQMRLEEISRFY